MTSLVDRGGTTPLLGRTQYFLGLVVLTYEIAAFHQITHYRGVDEFHDIEKAK